MSSSRIIATRVTATERVMVVHGDSGPQEPDFPPARAAWRLPLLRRGWRDPVRRQGGLPPGPRAQLSGGLGDVAAYRRAPDPGRPSGGYRHRLGGRGAGPRAQPDQAADATLQHP